MAQVPRYSWSLLAICIATAGCGRIERTRDCHALVETVNASHAEVSALADAAAPDKKAIAERYFAVAEKVRGMTFANPALQKSAEEYAALMEDTGLSLDEDRPMPPRTDGKPRPRPSLSHFPRRERTLVARINSACESP